MTMAITQLEKVLLLGKLKSKVVVSTVLLG